MILACPHCKREPTGVKGHICEVLDFDRVGSLSVLMPFRWFSKILSALADSV